MQRLKRQRVAALAAMAFAGQAAGHTVNAGAPLGWNVDPWMLMPLCLSVVIYLLGMLRMGIEQRRRIVGPLRPMAFGGGIVTLVFALHSPLDALSNELFSAHMTQHLLLMLVAPPLLVMGRPVITWLWAFDVQQRRAIGRIWMRCGPYTLVRPLLRPLPVWLLLTFVLWFWHLPAPYVWALNNKAVHVAEHVSFLVTSLAFWNIVIQPYGRRVLDYGASLLYVASIAVQNGMLGAVLTFAARPLYSVHGGMGFGLTPLEDQQLAGVIMWVPAGLIHLGTLCALFIAWLKEAERRAATVPTTFSASAIRGLLIAPLLITLLAGCTEDAAPPASWQVPGGDPKRGISLIRDYGCNGCHIIPGIAGPIGNVGPPLIAIGERTYIAGVLLNTPENLTHWIRFPQRVVPGNAMPNLGISEQDARDIAAYLYTLQEFE